MARHHQKAFHLFLVLIAVCGSWGIYRFARACGGPGDPVPCDCPGKEVACSCGTRDPDESNPCNNIILGCNCAAKNSGCTCNYYGCVNSTCPCTVGQNCSCKTSTNKCVCLKCSTGTSPCGAGAHGTCGCVCAGWSSGNPSRCPPDATCPKTVTQCQTTPCKTCNCPNDTYCTYGCYVVSGCSPSCGGGQCQCKKYGSGCVVANCNRKESQCSQTMANCTCRAAEHPTHPSCSPTVCPQWRSGAAGCGVTPQCGGAANCTLPCPGVSGCINNCKNYTVRSCAGSGQPYDSCTCTVWGCQYNNGNGCSASTRCNCSGSTQCTGTKDCNTICDKKGQGCACSTYCNLKSVCPTCNNTPGHCHRDGGVRCTFGNCQSVGNCGTPSCACTSSCSKNGGAACSITACPVRNGCRDTACSCGTCSSSCVGAICPAKSTTECKNCSCDTGCDDNHVGGCTPCICCNRCKYGKACFKVKCGSQMCPCYTNGSGCTCTCYGAS